MFENNEDSVKTTIKERIKNVFNNLASKITDLQAIEDINGYFLNNKRLDLIQELIDKLNQFKEAKDRGDEDAMKLAKMGAERLNVLRELKLPSKFELMDTRFKLTSNEAIENIEFLRELKEDYEKIPAKFRGENSPEVYFYDRITDYLPLQHLRNNPDVHDADG